MQFSLLCCDKFLDWFFRGQVFWHSTADAPDSCSHFAADNMMSVNGRTFPLNSFPFEFLLRLCDPELVRGKLRPSGTIKESFPGWNPLTKFYVGQSQTVETAIASIVEYGETFNASTAWCTGQQLVRLPQSG